MEKYSHSDRQQVFYPFLFFDEDKRQTSERNGNRLTDSRKEHDKKVGIYKKKNRHRGVFEIFSVYIPHGQNDNRRRNRKKPLEIIGKNGNDFVEQGVS